MFKKKRFEYTKNSRDLKKTLARPEVPFVKDFCYAMRTRMKWLNLIIGGVTGTVARYTLSGLVYQIFGSSFPYGTLVVNLTGCFLIGFFASLAEEKFLLGPNARILLMAGFCGAFTTFSTFIYETANLMKEGDMLRAGLNVLVSVAAGLLCMKLGILAAEIL